MLKQGMLIGAVVALTTGLVPDADAEMRLVQIDVCQVHSAAGYRDEGRKRIGDTVGLPIYPGPGDWPTCHQATTEPAKLMHRAPSQKLSFSQWRPPTAGRGDLCLSGKWAECYPD